MANANATHDTGAALSDGDEIIADMVSSQALSIGSEEEAPAAAALGDRDAAVELLLYEIRGLKLERTGLLSEHSKLQVTLSDTQTKLSVTESELKEIGCRASHLDDQLRIAQEELSAAKLAVVKHQDEFRQLEASIKNQQAMHVKVNNDLETKIKFLEEELEVSKQKQVDSENKFHQKELELSATILELKSELAIEKEKTLSIISGKGSKLQSQALGAVATVGVLALAAGAILYLRLSKRT